MLVLSVKKILDFLEGEMMAKKPVSGWDRTGILSTEHLVYGIYLEEESGILRGISEVDFPVLPIEALEILKEQVDRMIKAKTARKVK